MVGAENSFCNKSLDSLNTSYVPRTVLILHIHHLTSSSQTGRNCFPRGASMVQSVKRPTRFGSGRDPRCLSSSLSSGSVLAGQSLLEILSLSLFLKINFFKKKFKNKKRKLFSPFSNKESEAPQG